MNYNEFLQFWRLVQSYPSRSRALNLNMRTLVQFLRSLTGSMPGLLSIQGSIRFFFGAVEKWTFPGQPFR